MKKLTAYRLDVLGIDVLGIDGLGYTKLDGIINDCIKGDGRIAHSYWIGILASCSFFYSGDKTKHGLLEEITQEMQAKSIQGKITDFKEIPLGVVADEKYAPELRVTKLDENKEENGE